jgi:2-keto-4-pentenoate hydratase/2-oxohepta-3-ene-1,7-dioic acid hydratase in catechol pathway
VLRPKGVNLHYEVELGLVMGKQVRDLDPADEKGALDAISGELYLLLSRCLVPLYWVASGIAASS